MSRWEAYCRQVIAKWVIQRTEPLVYAAAWLWRRLLFQTTFVAVSGSLGKTTTKEMLGALLATKGRTYRTHRNQNGPTLVAMNVLRVRPWHRFAVIEADAGCPGMMNWPSRILRPDVSLMICIAGTHTDAFEDLDAHALEKRKMIDRTKRDGTIVINADDHRVAAMAEDFPGRVVRIGASGSAGALDWAGEVLSHGWPERLRVRIAGNGAEHVVQTQLTGIHWLHGILTAWGAALALGVDAPAAARCLSDVAPFPGRMFPVQAPNGAVFLRDDYNASLTVVNGALEVLRTARAERRWLVVTDLSDTAEHRHKRIRALAQRAAEVADVLLVIGERAHYAARRAVDAGIPEASAHGFDTLQEAARYLAEHSGPGDLILVKGRTTDHATRLVLAQFGEVSCWKPRCPKRMLCDICWEVSPKKLDFANIRPLPPQPAPAEAGAAVSGD